MTDEREPEDDGEDEATTRRVTGAWVEVVELDPEAVDTPDDTPKGETK